MKRVLVRVALLILVIGACTPQAQPTSPPSIIQEQPTHISTDLTPAQRVAISTLAKNLGLSPNKIKLVSTKAVDWPDSCLGIATEGIACSQVITSGFRVNLEANGHQVEYHTNQDASAIVPATVALTWKRAGGIAGFCDSLTLYLSGEVQGSTCKSADSVEKRLAALVSPAEIATLNGWISKYGVVNIDSSDPAGVADRMTVNLKLMGTGTEQHPSQEDQQLMTQFAQNLNNKLMTK